MKLAMIGLGRMGSNMAQRLLKSGHQVVGFDFNSQAVKDLAGQGAEAGESLADAVGRLESPKVVWVMVPHGEATEKTVQALAGLLTKGDVIIDGGNSNYKESIRRSRQLLAKGIDFVDCGTSGGVWGLERGFCLMAGGEKRAFDIIEPILASLAPGQGDIKPAGKGVSTSTAVKGYLHTGPCGSGHFVKMVHNGIEYGLMQAYAEGFHLLDQAGAEGAPEGGEYKLDTAAIAELWRRGSVVESWLLDLSATAMASDSSLKDFEGIVPDSGEGRWTLDEAVARAVAVPVISASVFARFRSRSQGAYGDRLLSAMRAGFGGHKENPS